MSQVTTKSESVFKTAQTVMPGGVSSPVRAFNAVGGVPRFITRAEGAYMWDEDRNKYIDMIGSWGPMIAGHAHPQVIQALKKCAESGTSFGAPTSLESDFAQMISQVMPNIEMLRFVSSGTEAAMSTVRLARAATGRWKVIKFAGCYHGHLDALLVKAGSGAAQHGSPSSPGVPPGVTADTLLLPYNDLDSVRTMMTEQGSEIAAILVEPIAGNMGFVRPAEGYLQGLRDLCDEHGAMLVFDEVMTGFRVAHGGMQALTGIRPDVTCLGKVIGGGLPVGAYGGSRKLMENISPTGPVYQGGTLSGNPMAMTAGMETLKLIAEPEFYDALTEKSRRLCEGFARAAQAAGVPLQTDYEGGMFGISFRDKPVRNFDDAAACDHAMFGRFFHAMLERGVHLPPSSYEAMFPSSAHGDAEIEAVIAAAAEAFREAAG